MIRTERPTNPHFDSNLVVWDDAYSGRYPPPFQGYNEQFDLQWRLSLRDPRYGDAPGASTDERYINDRIYEWIGSHPDGINGFHNPIGGVRKLDEPIPVEAIRGQRCLDAGCGMGRWTRVMLGLGATEVISVDVSPSALESTRRFNPNTYYANVMTLPEDHPEWRGSFAFVNFWGVAQHTHDPLKAFLSVASMVKEGGYLFLMVYADGGLHHQPLTNLQRKIFHSLQTVQERLDFVEHVFNRRWDWRYPLRINIEHVYANLRGFHKGTLVGTLDMLEPWYNWVIPWQVIEGWTKKGGFSEARLLNPKEVGRCAYHVLFRK
jgi:SAM-dependent methyltransferase